ncbi:MAG: succinylglutamate desuccinylase/aspartoacylase family protein, partial [Phycisphaerales bacterium]|nr:succinylglutamate desuccinylase/aspartoacylase family protein [Phycisphaerales bacterium]
AWPSRPTGMLHAMLRTPLVVVIASLAGCVSKPSLRVGETIDPTPPISSSRSRQPALGESVLGAPLEHRSLGRGRLGVLLIGLIHGSEPEGYARFDTLWAGLNTPEIRRLATVHAVPTMNPDGHAGQSRYNARGVDLNRNWPASNFSPSVRRGSTPLSEPETRAVHGLIEKIGPDLIIVFHSSHNGPFVDPDGPALAVAAAFADAASAIDPRWRLVPDYANPAGSLGTYAGLDRGIPTLTVEFDRNGDPAEVMEAARAGLSAAIVRASGERAASM